jgi:hypothetical protein
MATILCVKLLGYFREERMIEQAEFMAMALREYVFNPAIGSAEASYQVRHTNRFNVIKKSADEVLKTQYLDIVFSTIINF